MKKKFIFTLLFLFAFSGALCAQTAVNDHKFLYDTQVFERGYWEAKSGNETYRVQFKKVTKDIHEVFDMRPLPPDWNPILTLIVASYTYSVNGEEVYHRGIKDFFAPFVAGEYLTENELTMDFTNNFFKEEGKIVFTISPENPNMMFWLYTPRKRSLGSRSDYNRGEQKTPTHLVFYRKTDQN